LNVGVKSRSARKTIRPAGARTSVRLCLLDGFSLTCGEQTRSLSRGAQRLLALLAISDRPLNRAFVSGVLWPDSSERHASAALRSALWRFSQPDDGPATVMASPQTLALATHVEVDLRDAVAVGTALVSSGSVPEAVDVSMFTSDLLSDWYEDWAAVARERFRQLRLHALEAMCRLLAANGCTARAVEAGLAAVASEPLRESAHRVLIDAHLAEGNVGEALRQYESFRVLLRDELGVEPSALMEALISRVRGR